VKFIHAADVHVDSPLRGLQQYEGAPLERLRGATRDAFNNLVTLAIEQRVSFVLIAGDLFDGPWQDMQTGIWTATQFRRLERENIDVYLIRGNHDAASKIRPSMRWPANVKEFPTHGAETILREDLGVAIHGQGFAHREMPADLVPGYPNPIPGLFNIGMLHTSLTGDPQHDTYAPTSEEALVARGYDYWALGHIHARRTIRERPYIAFSGNTQGRHIRETGAKGCLTVIVADGEVESVEFHATDTLRWEIVDVALDRDDGRDELVERVQRRLAACHQAAEGRFSAVRLIVRGSCAAHRWLVRKAEREQLIADVRNMANEFDEELWVEKIRLDTTPLVDLEQLRRGTDIVGDLLRHISQVQGNEEELTGLAAQLNTLSDKAAVELSDAGVDVEDPAQLRGWLQQAEGLLVSQLLESQS
jgi:DNA repair exonuclease SbcCD nuclease subunit